MILLPLKLPNGAASSTHLLRKVEIDSTSSFAICFVSSFSSEADYLANANPLWSSPVPMPIANIAHPVMGSIELWLTQDATSPFAGGTVAADNSGSLSAAQTRKAAELRAACSAQVVAGFHSIALGADYLYPAKPLDQSNLTGSVLASLLPGNAVDWTTPFWCADIAGAWEFRLHSTSQIQQVGIDAKTSLIAALGKNEYLAGQVAAATTIAEVEAITWGAA
jgi:hypothetical protein